MGILCTHMLSAPINELANTPKMFSSCSKPLDEFGEVAVPFWEQCVKVVKSAGKVCDNDENLLIC
jgi:hypothetical protein